jgi:hypothetical protein
MLASCRDGDPLVGLGALCLGAEAIVPHLYAQVVAGFRAAGVDDELLDFFHIHIAGDDGHAQTMKAIIDREIQDDPAKTRRLKEAARKAIFARKIFFDGLWAATSDTSTIERAAAFVPARMQVTHDHVRV